MVFIDDCITIVYVLFCFLFCFVLIATQKFMATVDLSEADCKEELNVRIDSEFLVGKNANDEKWFEVYSDVLNGIETKLKNNKWTESFELFTKVDNALVDNLNKFINAVKQQLSKDSKALFCIKVSVFNISVVFFLLFFVFVIFDVVLDLVFFCLFLCWDRKDKEKWKVKIRY